MNIEPGRFRPTSAAEGVAERGKLALDLMLKALGLLDEDPSISPLIGSHLQLAIDRMMASRPGGSPAY